MSKEIEKRVMAGGLEQIAVTDTDQVQGLQRNVPIRQGLRDLAGLLQGGLIYWKQMVLDEYLP